MAIDQFIDKKFQAKTLAVIEQAAQITEDYKRRGFTLTLRQLYYQFVQRNLIENKLSEYKRLGSIIDDARQAGLIDWSTIEDRTRNVEHPNVWASAESILQAVARQYKENPWLNQEYWPEVWIEKDALVGVIEGVCTEFRVPYFACRGYASQSEIYAAGKRLAERRVLDDVAGVGEGEVGRFLVGGEDEVGAGADHAGPALDPSTQWRQADARCPPTPGTSFHVASRQ